jgi:Peptidase inhibitor I78 family
MKTLRLMPLATVILTGCQPMPNATGSGQPPIPELVGSCDGSVLSRYIGKPSTAQMHDEMMRASGAKTLRVAGPGMAVTMDYSPNRLTIFYNERGLIETASCG